MFRFFKAPIFRAFFVCVFLISVVFSFLIQSASATINDRLEYIYSFQDAQTGGIKEDMDSEPSYLQTDWAIMAFASAGFDPNTVVKADKSIVDFALQNACDLTSATDIERKVLTLESANVNSQSVSGCDLHQKLTAHVDTATGQIGNDIISTIFGVLALSAQNQAIPTGSIDYIVAAQQDNGGWDSGWGTESNITAQAIMALESADYTGEVLVKAKGYLKNIQTMSGGIKYDANDWSTESDAFSDSFSLMAIYATGEQPTTTNWLSNNLSILDNLDELSNSDGSYSFNRSYGKMTPVWTTSIVEIALNHGFLPIKNNSLAPYVVKVSPTPLPTISPIAPPTISPTPLPATAITMTPTVISPSTNAISSPIIFNTAKTTITATNQSPSQPLPETVEVDSLKLVLEPTNGSKEKSEWLKIDWRWIVLIFFMSLLTGGLFRFLQNRYIDEKK